MHVLALPAGAPNAGSLARRLAAAGVKVVLLADDASAEEAGRLAAEVHGAVFIGEEGLPEYLSELFGVSPSP